MKIPRPALSTQTASLHIFSDSSQHAYGAVAYLVNENQSNIILSKTKVAPIKKQLSIAKLELSAAVTASKLASTLHEAFKNELKITSTTFWIDSLVSLSWIRTNKELKAFENNRVQQIKQVSLPHQWKYVPTKQNPADLLSRGMKAKDFIISDLWFKGPQWLTSPAQWPEQDNLPIPEVPEIAVKVCSTQEPPKEPPLIDITKLSCLSKLYRVTAYVILFVQRCRKSVRASKDGKVTSKKLRNPTHKVFLKGQQIEAARNYWYKTVQREEYSEEIAALQQNRVGSNRSNQLDLFLLDGVVHSRGRIEHADLDWSAKYPILEESRFPLTK